MALFQLHLRKQIRNLPKILNSVKIIHYYSKLFTGVLSSLVFDGRAYLLPPRKHHRRRPRPRRSRRPGASWRASTVPDRLQRGGWLTLVYEETAPGRTPRGTRSFARLVASIPRHNLTVPEIKKIRRSPATGRAAFWKNPETFGQHLATIQQHSGKCCDFFL